MGISNWNTLKDARKEAREQINTGKVIYCSIGFDKHTGFYAQSNQNTHRSDRRYWVPDYDPHMVYICLKSGALVKYTSTEYARKFHAYSRKKKGIVKH